ncbi:hypothetical protein H8356DRAFT_1624161 [Neocallimastix lanati (nom. inval.)]|jgi:hypothetical protein|uniref:Uncharacterized protein n=1 Tax=Neocallimastix californiae TaxID=1754190 RepID=A0A1Y2E5S3_9FUNG|nr:hypothetical protein H8356DRAFT_1624161 [Neocallimastix sp. JGI-2020a]ORY66901.1 hypothetical protein LY90DRAFT_667831 [Neocallimastix californiae]|eukprot:ORY66901.1 hypothetical protein LY90DRAFT_667831 [Neocallimastix californiae]
MGFMSTIEKFKDIPIILGITIAAIIIDTSNPTVVNCVRWIYYSVHAINLIIIFLAHIDILNKNQKEKFTYTQITSTMGALGEDEVRVINIPIKDYDLINKNVLLRSNLIVLSALTFTHVCFGWTRPLLLQVYFPIKLLYVHPLIRVHVFQSEAKGQLARPWDMYSRVPLSTLGNVIRERPTTPKDIKNQKKELSQQRDLKPEEKAKKMKKRR